MFFLDHLSTSIEDITEYYRQQGLCSGESCDRFMQQVSQPYHDIMLLILILVGSN